MRLSLSASFALLCLALPAQVLGEKWAGIADIPGSSKPDVQRAKAIDPPSVAQLRQSNRIEQVARRGGKGLMPSERNRDTYLKYNVEPPTQVVKAASMAAKQSGSVQATNQPFDTAYYAPVKVGGQQFLLNFDTGSADLWVYSTQLPKNQRGNHTLYDLTAPKFEGETWDISYLDGSGAKGNVFADKVVVGGATATTIAVEAATSVSSDFVQRASDGLLGLAFYSINTGNPYLLYQFMDIVGPSLPKFLFTATLRKGKPGTYDFGFIDPTHYTGKIGYGPCDNSSGIWGLYPSAYQIGKVKKSTFFFTIADTGTSFLYLPEDIVTEYWGKVQGAYFNTTYQAYFFPCKSKLPNFSLVISGHKATVPGSYINVGPNGDGSCYGAMMPDTDLGISILGDTFLKSQMVVFDYNGPRLGFAQQRGIPKN